MLLLAASAACLTTEMGLAAPILDTSSFSLQDCLVRRRAKIHLGELVIPLSRHLHYVREAQHLRDLVFPQCESIPLALVAVSMCVRHQKP